MSRKCAGVSLERLPVNDCLSGEASFVDKQEQPIIKSMCINIQYIHKRRCLLLERRMCMMLFWGGGRAGLCRNMPWPRHEFP